MSSSLLSSSNNTTDECLWEGRSWLYSNMTDEANHEIEPTKFRGLIRFCSYNITPDIECVKLRYTNIKLWMKRRSVSLVHEIFSYKADIICLQGVDHFQDWWRPAFSARGYDTIFQRKSQIQGLHDDGVLVAYRRSCFQVFQSVTVDLNEAVNLPLRKASIRDRLINDDVGLIVHLQGYSESFINSSLCVCCTTLSQRDGDADVRLEQCKYFLGQVEKANRDFHVPLLLGMSLNDDPSSSVYHLLTTGRLPVTRDVPERLQRCTVVPTCRGSLRLFWLPPRKVVGVVDMAIESYIVQWRPGGSEVVGFSSEKVGELDFSNWTIDKKYMIEY